MSKPLKRLGAIVTVAASACAGPAAGEMIVARLEPWIRLDVTPALDMPLMADTIRDEGVTIAAQPGMVFLTLPLRYDRRGGAWALSKKSFRGRDMRGLYGFRVPPVHQGSPQLAIFGEQEPIYERVERKGDDGGDSDRRPSKKRQDAKTSDREGTRRSDGRNGSRLTVKNTLGPRRIEGAKTKRERPKSRPRSVRGSGWVALVVEIPRESKRVTFEWTDGVKEVLDLEFLRRAADPPSGLVKRRADRGDPMPPAVAAIVSKLTDRSGATTALAIRQLARLQREMQGGTVPGWGDKIDAGVITAGARSEEGVGAAAWSYFASRSSVPEAAVARLGRKNPRTLRAWIRLIESAAADGGRWDGLAAARLLGGILRSEDSSVCSGALDLLLGLGADVDWALAEHASETAQTLMLSRLETITDRASAMRLLLALTKNVRPATAERIAGHARRLNIRIESPDDPILGRWSQETDAVGRVGLLRVLGAVSLGDLVYCRRFAAIVREATADGADDSVREAAFDMLVQQGRRKLEESPIRNPQSAIRNRQSAIRGGFPILVSIDAHDPLVRGLAEAAEAGSSRVRVGALAALLRMGYAEEAARALVGRASSRGEPVALLKQLLALEEDVSRCSGLLAMLGRLLREEHLPCIDAITSHLSQVWTATPAPQRWGLAAALKAGADFEAMNRLRLLLGPPASDAVARWLHELGHMTVQDQQRLAAARDAAAGRRRLERIDRRRGYLVDGRYGAVAVVETVAAQRWPEAGGPSDPRRGHYRWSAPRRVTVLLSPLRLESGAGDAAYRVWQGDQDVGGGSAKNTEKILPPSGYSPRLVDAPADLASTGGWGWRNPLDPSEPSSTAVGPVVLGERPVSPNPGPGTMTLDIGRLLVAALRTQRVFADEDLEGLVPQPYEITLRYAAFGSFYGVAPRRPLPDGNISPGRRHLLNVMLVLERMD